MIALSWSFSFNILLVYGYSRSDPGVLMNWIVKDVCEDKNHRPIALDPYVECPSGTTRRKLLPSDPIPYHNVDQLHVQQRDNFIVFDAKGNQQVLSTFDYAPFNEFNLFSDSDGFDEYFIGDEFLGISATRDGGGYSSTFLGSNCVAGTAWLAFPVQGFLDGGSAESQITINYWEESAESYPGPCPASYSTTTTAWLHHPGYVFGGVDGNPVKTMDAMISYHGFCGAACSMEVFWYTREYGMTMWQAWLPANSPNAPVEGVCRDQGYVIYKGYNFTIVDCRDWSVVTLAVNSQQLLWPLPSANLLQHGHFDKSGSYSDKCGDSSFYVWCRTPSADPSSPTYINYSPLVTSNFSHTSYGTHEVSYLAANCGGKCDASKKFIYQDIPIAAIQNDASYLYGLDVRCEGRNCHGSLEVALQIIGANNEVLHQDTGVFGGVLNDNGDGRTGEEYSVYYSSRFFSRVALLSWLGSAQKLRLVIAPTSEFTLHILDVYVNPFPTISHGLGTIEAMLVV